MNIRNYHDSDFSRLVEILQKTDLYYEPLDQRDIFQKQVEHDSESILVAEDNGTVVGGVFVLYHPFFSSIWHLCVHPDYQERGIGGKLMEKAEEVLQQRGIERPGIFVEESNPQVIEFYKKRGWNIFDKVHPMEKEI